MQNNFIILEGCDGVGKTKFQDIILSYYHHTNPNRKIISDKQIKSGELSIFVNKLRANPSLVSKQALQHISISVQIDNFYRYLLPVFLENGSAVFDRSWMSTYVYSLYYGITKIETDILVKPIGSLWENNKHIIPCPIFLILDREHTLKPNELNSDQFEELRNLYRFAANQDIFKDYKIFFISNNSSSLEITWKSISDKLKIEHIPLYNFYLKNKS